MSHPFVEQAQVLEDIARNADRWTDREQVRAWRAEARRLRQLAASDEVYDPEKEVER